MNTFSKVCNMLLVALLVAMPVMAAEELIGEWLLDEPADGGIVYDTSGYGYDAVVKGGAAFDASQGAFYFNGTGDFLEIVNAVYPHNYKADFRITLDVKTTATGSRPIFSRRASSGWEPGDWFFGLNNGLTSLQCGWVGAYGPGTKVVNDGMWHSVDMQYVADGDTAYINIDSSSTDDLVASPFKGATNDNSGLIWIGNHSNYQFFEGWIRNVRVYRIFEQAYNPSPAMNSTGNPTGLQTLSWMSPDEAVTWFDVYISADQALVADRDEGVKAVSYTTNTSIDYEFAGETEYFWAVDCFYDPNTANEIDEYALWEGLEGDVWNFTTLGNYALSLSPANASTALSVFTNLRWSVDFPADSYNVYLANSAAELDSVAPVNFVDAGTEIIYDLGTLELHRTYFWKVGVVRDETEYLSSVRWFRTAGIETIENFTDYITPADVQAVWQSPIWQDNNLNISPEYGRYALVAPFETTEVSYTRTFDQALDFSVIPTVAFEFYIKTSQQGTNPTSFTVSLLNSSNGVIAEKTIASPADFITPSGQDIEGNWHWAYMSVMNASGINDVKKIRLSVPGQSGSGDLRLNIISMRVPYCEPGIIGDAYGDCTIDIRDLALVAQGWLECNRIPFESCFTYWFQASLE